MKTTDHMKEEALSTTEQNKNLLRKAVEEIWNKGNFGLLNDFVTDDFVVRFSRPGEELHGPDNVRQFYSNLREAFPDIKFEILHQIAEGDKVVTHWLATGTHKGVLSEIPPDF